MTSTKDEHLTTQVENAKLHSTVQELTSQLEVVRDREETLQYTE